MPLADKIYNKLAEDEVSPVCDDIDESACTHRQLSFVLILLSSALTKLGDAIASPKTTLAWVATAVGAPAFILGFLVPVRESGSMIPQIFIGARVRPTGPVRFLTLQRLPVSGLPCGRHINFGARANTTRAINNAQR